jgi:hypothetical protein
VSRAAGLDAPGRVRELVEGAKRIADASSELGRRARAELVTATGLSRESVELAFAECLEMHVSDREIEEFCRGVESASSAHVLLSANVFVAAHRAVALALAASPTVRVRPSRREPVFVRLLAEAAPGLFEIADELSPARGDVFFAYGTDETLESVRKTLAPGVRLHAHGSGFGVAIVDAAHATRAAAHALARDVAPFDQRGCLSPRSVVFSGDDGEARSFAELVAVELAVLSESLPLGVLDPDELADVTRFRDAFTVAGSAISAGPGWVAVGRRDLFAVAPVGRNLVMVPTNDAVRLLTPGRSSIAALGFSATPALAEAVRGALPGARPSPLGQMQRPPFDGPVDRR